MGRIGFLEQVGVLVFCIFCGEYRVVRRFAGVVEALGERLRKSRHGDGCTKRSESSAAVRSLFVRVSCVLLPFSVVLVKYPSLAKIYKPWTGEALVTGVSTDKNMLGMVLTTLAVSLIWALMRVRGAESWTKVAPAVDSDWPDRTRRMADGRRAIRDRDVVHDSWGRRASRVACPCCQEARSRMEHRGNRLWSATDAVRCVGCDPG